MAAKARLRELIDEHLDLGPEVDIGGSVADWGVSSVAAVAFLKSVEEEFDISIAPGDFDTLDGLAAHIDANAG